MNSNSFLTSNNNLQSLSTNERLKSFFKPSSELASAKLSQQSYFEELKVNISRGASSGRQVFSKSIEFSLGVKYEPSYEFKLPSPKEVAATVLGFVENRINAERLSGAFSERLNNLMAQAKSGIDKGYAQAEKDIKGLGLMTDELAEEISEGFILINQGLDKIKQGINVPAVDTDLNNSGSPKISDATTQNTPLTDPSETQARVSPDLFARSGEIESANDLSSKDIKAASSFKQLTENTADFVLNTREGDQILIRMSDLQSVDYAKNSTGEALNIAQSSAFELSVKGDLNGEELQAINDVLAQVGNISSLFFSDQFEEAFSSALNLGFDSSQIASFALDLSKLQVQEVRTYEEGPKNAMDSYKRNQSLINMAQQFERLDSLIEPLERFEKIQSMIEDLVSKAIERYSVVESENDSKSEVRVEDFQEFSKKLLDSMFLAE
jgi:hypothetical protein